MAKFISGYINLSEAGDAVREGSEAVFTNKKGQTCLKVVVWVNDEEDDYGQDSSFQANTPKDSVERKRYIGNGKSHGISSGVPAPVPTRPAAVATAQTPANSSGLPF